MAARSEHARIEAAHRSRIDDSNGLSSTSWGGEGSWRAFTKIHGGQKLRSLCSPLFPPLVLFSIQLFHSFPAVLFIRIGPLLLSPPLIGRLALFLSINNNLSLSFRPTNRSLVFCLEMKRVVIVAPPFANSKHFLFLQFS